MKPGRDHAGGGPSALAVIGKETDAIKRPRIRVNDQIRASEVRLIDQDGNQLGIVACDEALGKARQAGLDLVEVAPNAKPPVCKIVDHGKLLFDQRRRQRQQKKKQHLTVVKEVKMRLKIDKHDYETKVKRARKFLEQGDKVKFTILFRGREVTHQEIGRELCQRVQEDLADIAEVEGGVSRMGKVHSFMMARRKDWKPGEDDNGEGSEASAAENEAETGVPNEAETGDAANEAEPAAAAKGDAADGN